MPTISSRYFRFILVKVGLFHLEGVPLYLFVGPERGLVAGPGMAVLPCH